MKNSFVLTLFLQLLTLAGFGQLATDLQADLAGGKVTVDEIFGLAEDVPSPLEKYLPGQTQTLEDVKTALKDLQKVYDDLSAKAPAKVA